MLSRKLRKQLKKPDMFFHPECSHNIIHYAGKACEYDAWSFSDSINNVKPEDYIKDSDNLCPMYICTMCGGFIWSSEKLEGIEHYRVREVKKHINK